MKTIFNQLFVITTLLLLFVGSGVVAQTTSSSPYGAIADMNNYNLDLFLSNVTIGAEINQSGVKNDNLYNYYNNLSSATAPIGGTLSGSIELSKPTWADANILIWVDFNRDGVFDNSSGSNERLFLLQNYGGTATVLSTNFNMAVPATASTGISRMRVLLTNNGNGDEDPLTPYDIDYRAGDAMDFNVNITGSNNTKPNAVCQNIAVTLDSGGNAIISPSQINNGSTDTQDDASSTALNYSLDKTTFNCNNIGSNTVTLTVTDSGGLTDTCTATVTVNAYSGGFQAPVLETINAYCNYTATAPVMNYQCNTLITGTTNNPTSFSSNGNHVILWSFTHEGNTVYANQQITIISYPVPTSVTTSAITTDSATINWAYSGTETYKVRYRANGTSNTWAEKTTTNKNITLTGLDDNLQYEVQVKVDNACASYSSSSTFTTTEIVFCNPANYNEDKHYITNVTLGDIDNTTGKSSNTNTKYTYFQNKSTVLTVNNSYNLGLTFVDSNNSNYYFKVWIDYNNDGDFNDTGEEIASYTGQVLGSVIKSKTFTVPGTAVINTTRMRVLISSKDTDACSSEYQSGEIEDYKIIIKPEAEVPTAACVGSLNVSLDISGNATITADQINNNSFDDYNNAGDLILSIDKTTFTCDNLGANTVNLTVTDLDGLTDTCTATVNVSAYSGTFEAPVLETITKYCGYTIPAPVMNYQCNTTITGTTSSATSYSTAGSYTILWSFNNGGTVVNSNQTINIINPTTPTGVTVSDIAKNKATVSWSAVDSGPFKVRYKENVTSTWIEKNNITTKNIILTGLHNGALYDVQVSVDADCATYTRSTNFTTVEQQYCEPTSIGSVTTFYISNVTFGSINKNSTSGGNYIYHSGVSTTVAKSSILTGTVTYQSPNWTGNNLKIWIDYNQNGVFSSDELLVIPATTGIGPHTKSINITIPNTAVTGKTRMRVYLSNVDKSDPCIMSTQGNVQDFDLYITAPDTSLFEAAMITQVYQTTTEKWIEVTNKGSVAIPANTVVLAIYKDKTGDQTGVTPTSTFTVNTALAAGGSALIKNGNSASLVSGGTVNADITAFAGANDILAVVSTTGTTAWANRFDVISGIADNTSYVRNDEILTYNKTYTTTEWTAFTTDNITEVTSAATTANARLGVHKFGATTRSSSAWSNGTPDRSRVVVISDSYTESTAIKARKLSITGTNKLTVNNQEVLVVNDLDIAVGAELRLAGTSQLIQTHTGNKQISGTGSLYIDQNSTVASKYRFNYMSSPVRKSGNSTNFKVADVLKDGSIATSSSSTAVDINFVSGYDGSKTAPISIADYWIYTYPGDEEGYVQKGSTNGIPQANGFTIKGPGVAQNYTFVGVPYDGDISVSLDSDELMLVGNPYPSAMNAAQFIVDNTTKMRGTLYFWQHVESSNENHNAGGYVGGYATRNATMGVAADNLSANDNIYTGETPDGGSLYTAPGAYIPVGQAFFIQGTTAGGTVTFKNGQRKYVTEGNESVFLKTASQVGNLSSAKTVSSLTSKTTTSENKTPIIKLGMNYKNDENILLHSQIGISFTEGKTFAPENGYDSPAFNGGDTSIYWKFPNDDENYSIAGVQSISNDLEVPLEIVMGYDGELTINIDEWQAIDRNVYLKDKEKNTATKINSNTATLNLTPNTYTDRFYLAFDNTGFLSSDDLDVQNLSVSYDEDSKNIELKNTENVNIYKVELFSIVGQQVISWETFNEDLYTGSLASGVYMVKITTDNGDVNKKIFIR